MRRVTHIADLGPDGVRDVLAAAERLKAGARTEHLAGKVLGMIFFNPSLRTRVSFEAAMIRGGGHAISLDVGGGVWKLEDREGAVMDGDRSEHVAEAAPVLSRYVDLLAVRSFSDGSGDEADERDAVIRAFARYATVPLVSMESAREHPCQGLADLLTIREEHGDLRGLTVTLTWAPHVKPLPKAVPNSFLLTAAACGCDVRVVHPPGCELHGAVIDEARRYAESSGGSVTLTNDQDAALAGSRVLYAKAWGAARTEPAWMPTSGHLDRMHASAILMHCLPVRRNVEVADSALDDPRSRVVDEGENRLHVQRALLDRLATGVPS